MMINRYQLNILSLLLILSLAARAQDSNKTDTLKPDLPYTANLEAMAKAYPDSIVIRWAPDDPGGWLYANRFGYIVERTTIQQEDSIIDPASYRKIHTDTLRPWPLDDWESIANEEANNPYAAIAAQMLYADDKADSLTWMEAADYLETRYSFALLSADLSHTTAEALALRYVDKEVEEDKTYIYRISSPVDTALYTINPGFVVINSSDLQPIPPPIIDKAVELEDAVELRWNRQTHDQYFSAYYIERADRRNGPFKRRTKQPFLHPITEGLTPNQDIVFTDSVDANYQPHFYRIIGITPFGELSPPSDTVRAMGRDRTPPPAPTNVKTEMVDTSSIKITWEMPNPPADLQGFYVGKSRQAKEGFDRLFEAPLPPNARSYTDHAVNQHISNFYIVGAVDTAGNGNVSLVEYGKMIDSIPPAPPTGLTGKIDTSGVVRLSWDRGPERDIMGYQIYFANDTTHEFSQLTKGIWQDTTFADTITVKTLTEKIYYKISAVDMVYHYSEFSDILELKKPDIIPPTQPVFNDYKISESGIRIEWLPSSSHDVVKHQLFRKTDTSDWQVIYTEDTMSNINFYVDEDVQPNTEYQYTLEAIDDDSLHSGKAYTLRLKMIDFETRPSVKQFFGFKDEEGNTVNLNWEYPYEGIHKFVLFKSIDGSGFFTYKQLDEDSLSFNDDHVKPDTAYKYALQVIYDDGKKTPIGKVVEVKY